MKKQIRSLLLLIFGSTILDVIIYFIVSFLCALFTQIHLHQFNNIRLSFEDVVYYLPDKRVAIIGIIAMSAATIGLVISYIKTTFFNSSKFVQKFKKSDSNLYGSSKLMLQLDMIKNFGTQEKRSKFFSFKKLNSRQNISTPSAGWLIQSKLEDGCLKYLFYIKDANMVTIGSPGSGKTRYFLVPNIVLNASNSVEKPTMIINDVKGELFNLTSKKLQDCGYRILNLNLRRERTSTRFNPLEIIWKYFQIYTNKLTFKMIDSGGSIMNKITIDLSEHPTIGALCFDLFTVKFSKTKNQLDIIFKDKNIGIGILDLKEGSITYSFGSATIFNENIQFQIIRKNPDGSRKKMFSIQLFKDADFLDKTSSEILSLSSTIIPKGAGENQTWNTGSRGIIEGAIWAMLEDSLDPKLNMRLDKFIFNNIGNIINGNPKEMIEWFKLRDSKTSKAKKAAAMIVDNDSEKTVSSYISNTQTLLKEYLTSGIAYLTSASDFTLDELVDTEQPVALYITIPDENATKYPIANLLIKEIYNYMIYKATLNEGNHLKRKAYFYLDEFAQMPKIDEFKQWINASRSRWIYFNIVIQSVSQLYATYKKDEGLSILNACSIHAFLGSSDLDTVKYFHDELGTETVVSKSSSASTESFAKEQTNANYSLTKKDLIQMNELTEMKQGEAYIKILRLNPIKTTFVPYFDKHANKLGIFTSGSVMASAEEKIFSERETYYSLDDAIKIINKTIKNENIDEDDEDEFSEINPENFANQTEKYLQKIRQMEQQRNNGQTRPMSDTSSIIKQRKEKIRKGLNTKPKPDPDVKEKEDVVIPKENLSIQSAVDFLNSLKDKPTNAFEYMKNGSTSKKLK